MSKKKALAIKKFRILNPHSYHLHQLRWYYKRRGELKLETVYRPTTDEEEAAIVADEKLKSVLKGLPPDWLERYKKLMDEWLTLQEQR